jgi:TrmH family RNA methyltransferase
MLSKAQIKLIRSLKYKKFRDKYGLFVVEGEKVTKELLTTAARENNKFLIHSLFASTGWLYHNMNTLAGNDNVFEITDQDLKKISFLSTPNEALALVKIPEFKLDPDFLLSELTLVIDTVQDPGNLGTIVRIAHWYGIPDIICSPNSVDFYNPKTIQSTMGSFLSVRIFYTDLKPFIKYFYHETELPIYGTFLSGANIYTQQLEPVGLIILGNESQGISDEIKPYIRTRLNIPAFSSGNKPDSLNIAQATAIICSEFRRRRL